MQWVFITLSIFCVLGENYTCREVDLFGIRGILRLSCVLQLLFALLKLICPLAELIPFHQSVGADHQSYDEYD